MGDIGDLAKNDKILKTSFFTRFCSQGTRRVGKLPISVLVVSNGRVGGIGSKMTKFLSRKCIRLRRKSPRRSHRGQ